MQQNSKSFVKKALGYAPPVGVTALLGESIFVDRNWEKDKPMLEKSLVNLTEYPDPIWVSLAQSFPTNLSLTF